MATLLALLLDLALELRLDLELALLLDLELELLLDFDCELLLDLELALDIELTPPGAARVRTVNTGDTSELLPSKSNAVIV